MEPAQLPCSGWQLPRPLAMCHPLRAICIKVVVLSPIHSFGSALLHCKALTLSWYRSAMLVPSMGYRQSFPC